MSRLRLPFLILYYVVAVKEEGDMSKNVKNEIFTFMTVNQKLILFLIGLKNCISIADSSQKKRFYVAILRDYKLSNSFFSKSTFFGLNTFPLCGEDV